MRGQQRDIPTTVAFMAALQGLLDGIPGGTSETEQQKCLDALNEMVKSVERHDSGELFVPALLVTLRSRKKLVLSVREAE